MFVVENPFFLALPTSAADLFEQAAEESFFSSAPWYDLMSRFGTEGARQIRLYLDSEIRSQLALVTRAGGTEGVKDCRVLRSLTNAYSCEHRIILAPSVDRALPLQQLAQCLASETPPWQGMILAGLDSGDAAVGVFAAALRSVGMAVKPFFDSGTWYEQTNGLTFADYFATRPSILRSTWRRKAARLERFGPPQFRYYDSVEELERGITEYQEVYRNSWKPDENFPLFIPELIRTAARVGALRMGTLYFGGRPVAAQFWIVWRGKACIYKLAHDKSVDEFSPGTILTMRMMESVLNQDKPAEVNFGRGDDPYKKLWLPRRRERWGLAVANPRTLRGFGQVLRQTAGRIMRPVKQGALRPPADWI